MSQLPEETTLGGATREQARDRAKAIRELHRKQERRRRAIVAGSIVGGVVIVIGVVAVLIVSAIRPPAQGPLNMLSDGILITGRSEALLTSAVPADGQPQPTVVDPASSAVRIVVYSDFINPESAEFFTTNSDQIGVWLDSRAATLELHPLAVLDNTSHGYSTRATNAAGCVANYDPNTYNAFNAGLFRNQPTDEDTSGLTDAELLDQAKAAGATQEARIRDCIADLDFKSWVDQSTARAQAGPIPNSDEGVTVTTLPTVLVNGAPYTGAPADDQAFAAFVLQAAGTQFNDETDPTATPTPEPTVAPTTPAVETPVPTTTP